MVLSNFDGILFSLFETSIVSGNIFFNRYYTKQSGFDCGIIRFALIIEKTNRASYLRLVF